MIGSPTEADAVLAGVRARARQVGCTINGLGERAGNAALEEVAMALRTRGAPLGAPAATTADVTACVLEALRAAAPPGAAPPRQPVAAPAPAR